MYFEKFWPLEKSPVTGGPVAPPPWLPAEASSVGRRRRKGNVWGRKEKEKKERKKGFGLMFYFGWAKS